MAIPDESKKLVENVNDYSGWLSGVEPDAVKQSVDDSDFDIKDDIKKNTVDKKQQDLDYNDFSGWFHQAYKPDEKTEKKVQAKVPYANKPVKKDEELDYNDFAGWLHTIHPTVEKPSSESALSDDDLPVKGLKSAQPTPVQQPVEEDDLAYDYDDQGFDDFAGWLAEAYPEESLQAPKEITQIEDDNGLQYDDFASWLSNIDAEYDVEKENDFSGIPERPERYEPDEDEFDYS